jgi:hypothetical protein
MSYSNSTLSGFHPQSATHPGTVLPHNTPFSLYQGFHGNSSRPQGYKLNNPAHIPYFSCGAIPYIPVTAAPRILVLRQKLTNKNAST